MHFQAALSELSVGADIPEPEVLERVLYQAAITPNVIETKRCCGKP